MDKKIEEFINLPESQQQAFLNYETVALQKTISTILSNDIESLKNQPDEISPQKMDARRQLIELYESLEYVDVVEPVNGNETIKLEPKRFVNEQIERIKSKNHKSVREYKKQKHKQSVIAKIERKLIAYWQKNFTEIRKEVVEKAIDYLNSKESDTDFKASITNGSKAAVKVEKPTILFDSIPVPKNAADIREFTKIYLTDKLMQIHDPIDLDSISNECNRYRTESGEMTVVSTTIESDEFATNPKRKVEEVFETVLAHKNNLYKSMDMIRKEYLSKNTKSSTFDVMFRSVNDFALSVEKIAKMISNNCNEDHLKLLRTLQCKYYGAMDVDRDKKSITTKKDKQVTPNTNNVPSDTNLKTKTKKPKPIKQQSYKSSINPTAKPTFKSKKPAFKINPEIMIRQGQVQGQGQGQGSQHRPLMSLIEPFQPGKRPIELPMTSSFNMNQSSYFGGRGGPGGSSGNDTNNGNYGPPMKKMNLMNSINQQQQSPINRMGAGPFNRNQMQPPAAPQPPSLINNSPNYINTMHDMNEYFTRREPHEYQQTYNNEQSNYYPNYRNRRPY